MPSKSSSKPTMKLLSPRFSRESNATKSTLSKLQHIEPELLVMILTPLADGDSEDQIYNKSTKKKVSRSAMLRATGLVCRSWLHVSQILLYTHPQPKSYGAVRILYKTIRRNPLLASRVKSLAPPIFSSWYTQPRKTAWRARRIYLCFSRAGVEISENDYHSMLRLFHAVALQCPNLIQISLPVSQLAGQVGINPELCLGEWQTSNITSLTLSPLVFPQMKKRSLLRPFPQICFPRLKTLTVQDLSLFILEVVTCIKTPVLESLTIDGACGAYSVLKTLIDSVKDTLRSLEVKRILFYREAETIGDFDDEGQGGLQQVSFLTDAVYPESLPQGLKHLAVEATSQPKFSDDVLIHNLPFFVPFSNTVSTLETLSLMASKASTFVELDYCYSSLRTLRMDYMNSGLTSSQDSHTFKMVEALARFIKNKDVLAPQLKTVELRWRYVKTASLGWMVCCLAFCLRKRCEKYEVEFELELESLNDCFDAYAWLNAEEWALDTRRWSKNNRFRLLPFVDKCLSKLGYKAY